MYVSTGCVLGGLGGCIVKNNTEQFTAYSTQSTWNNLTQSRGQTIWDTSIKRSPWDNGARGKSGEGWKKGFSLSQTCQVSMQPQMCNILGVQGEWDPAGTGGAGLQGPDALLMWQQITDIPVRIQMCHLRLRLRKKPLSITHLSFPWTGATRLQLSGASAL